MARFRNFWEQQNRNFNNDDENYRLEVLQSVWTEETPKHNEERQFASGKD
jgi:hypothetical protein